MLRTLAFDDPASSPLAVGPFVALALYCFARPQGGLDVFGIVCLPGFAATLLHELFGVPRWVAAVLVAVALYLAWCQDEPPDNESTAGTPNEPAVAPSR